MLKILQVRQQQCVNQALLDDQAGFRKGRGTKDQIANICWIIKKEEIKALKEELLRLRCHEEFSKKFEALAQALIVLLFVGFLS